MKTLFGLSAWMMILQLSLPSAAALGGEDSLRQSLRQFEVQASSGVPVQTAFLELSQRLYVEATTGADLDSYLRGRMSAAEYRRYKDRLSTALRGIGEENLTATELAELAATVASDSRSRGLSWSSCPGLQIGTYVTSAATIALIIYAVSKHVKPDEAKLKELSNARDAAYEFAKSKYEVQIQNATSVDELVRLQKQRDEEAHAIWYQLSNPIYEFKNEAHEASKPTTYATFGAVISGVAAGMFLAQYLDCY